MAIAFVQNMSSGLGTLSPGTAKGTWSSNPTAGNMLVLAVSGPLASGTANVTAVNDNQGNAYTRGPHFSTSANSFLEFWYTSNIVGGTNIGTVVGTASAVTTTFAWSGYEYSGAAKTLPFDVGTIIQGTQNAASGLGTTGTTATTAQPNEVLVAAFARLAVTAATVGAGWSHFGTTITRTSFDELNAEDQIVSAAGAYAGTYSDGISGVFIGGLAAFRQQNILGSALQDDFNNSTTIDARWAKLGGQTTRITQGTGQLVITSGTDATYNDLVSTGTPAFDMNNSAMFVQYAGTISPTLTNVEQIFYVSKQTAGTSDTQNKVYWTLSGGNAVARKVVANVNAAIANGTFAWTGGTTWLRISGTNTGAGSLLWDTSPDGTVWTNFVQIAEPFSISAMYGAMQVGAFGTQATTTAGTFDFFGTTTPAPASGISPNWLALMGVGQT